MTSYCINPWCAQRKNTQADECCGECGTPLLIQGRYRLLRPLRELDEWGLSEIFEIEDRADSSGQPKVLKILKKESFQPQFEREIKTLQHLQHVGIPAIAPDGDFAVEIGARKLYCLVMEKIQGQNLDVWLQENGSIGEARAIDWMRQLVEVLGKLHSESLFHRDIKLSNIMLRPSGELALIDFGTVRPMSGTYFAKISGQRDITSVVSPGYTPLEQINGKAVPQSDFYALGRSLVYLLTGRHPIDLPEDEATGLLTWRSYSDRPISDWFAQLLDDMMAPFLAQRPLNAEALLARLAQAQQADAQPLKAQQAGVQPVEKSSPKASFLLKQRLRLLVALNLAALLLNAWFGWQWTRALEARQKTQVEAGTSSQPALSRLW